MLFQTFEFQLLLAITMFIYYLFPKKRLLFLGIVNAVFYGVSGVAFLGLFLLISFITYICALNVHGKYGKKIYAIGIVLNVSNLIFFKYANFLIVNLTELLGINLSWNDSFVGKIVLPIGISFYTFQLIAYLVDVKRNDIEAEKSFLKFWVFISFFPKIISGPIMRGKNFLPQIHNLSKYKWSERNLKHGMYFILMGLCKKIIFADNLSPIVDQYFNQVGNLNSIEAWYSAYLFAFQIYFDFSAYSEIAMGVGYLFGLKLDLNFLSPYISKNPSEFWKRWHITLSSWIRDYIYIPLGGNQKGFTLKCIYLFIAMTISGLWHGAAWTFILWGVFHGLLSILHNVYVRYFSKTREILKRHKVYNVVCIFVFFQITTIGWVLFRANSIGDAIILIKKMIFISDITLLKAYIKNFVIIFALYMIHVLEYYLRTNENKIRRIWESRVPEFLRAFVYTSIIVILILTTKSGKNTFIYLQF